jgi:hypothetical protein
MCVGKCARVCTLLVIRNVARSGALVGMRLCAPGPVLVTMTQHSDVLGQLRNEWDRKGRTREARISLLVLIDHSPELGLETLGDLCDVVRVLERGGGRSVLERAALIQALLECARDQLIARTLLQTMLPGVVSVCRQLRFGEGIIRDPSETLAMALGLASELIADWAGQSRQYAAPDILSALRGRLRRWLLKEKAALGALSYFEQRDEPATEDSPLLTRLGSFRGSQYERIARLTYERVFEGRSLIELAATDHSAPGSLRAELQHFAQRHLL